MTAANLTRLYWAMRLGMAFIWLWTAYVSWYLYPQAESIAWLQRSGITSHTGQVFAASCLADLLMGIGSLVHARPWLWWMQCALVAGYSLVIALFLPEFLIHPFGPLTKNITLAIGLVFLALYEKSRG
ncbi:MULTISPECIES: DoxX-like family protein [unclassified Janthinobacterium]|uniref:DoxX-like family protein n=1 Tax=unclassified Janthinobacterium TaxID=2610881 RepID=UPI00161B9F64|nr:MULTISPECIES: DoxX-like family protein [unclassified Janthinobacterium]MBB5367956.1 hypothetical protein [Janthinobacterium sp. K2C7]MBB5379566.1 hypothetical protein [Janthinobacterium sp. K2Li3]MBB5386338.1 hypothetical protein [Janthinobacterium sp. K2E3]